MPATAVRQNRRPPFPLALISRTLAAWASALLLFFPLGWLVLTAFKTELQAISQIGRAHV